MGSEHGSDPAWLLSSAEEAGCGRLTAPVAFALKAGAKRPTTMRFCSNRTSVKAPCCDAS